MPLLNCSSQVSASELLIKKEKKCFKGTLATQAKIHIHLTRNKTQTNEKKSEHLCSIEFSVFATNSVRLLCVVVLFH